MAPTNVLISGAGVAGPTLALLLARSKQDFRITIMERSPEPRVTGQQIDLRRSGITVIDKLGLLEDLKAITTEETGLAFVDRNNNVKAAFPVQNTGGEEQGFTSEYEFLRGKFAELLHERTKDLPNVRYVFGERVASIDQSDGKAHVTFKNSRPNETYDIIVAADGFRSRTRDIAWASYGSSASREADSNHSPYHSLDQFIAYFSIPTSKSDWESTPEGLARWCNAPGRRLLWRRPNHRDRNYCSTYLGICVPPASSPEGADPSGIRQRLTSACAHHDNIPAQKALMRSLFADAGWEADTILDEMDKAEDFYLQEIAQVRLKPTAEEPHLAWSRGRIVCLGDAGYAPTPITAMGTTLAIQGAYVLAGELAEAVARKEAARRDVEHEAEPHENATTEPKNANRTEGDKDPLLTALATYESKFQPYVTAGQSLPPFGPKLANPETEWGIWAFNAFNGLIARSGLIKVLSRFVPATSKESFGLPVYGELGLD